VQCSALHCTRHRSTVQHSTPADAVRVLCGALCLLSCAVLCRANNVRHHAAADAAAGLVPVPREHGRQLQRGRGVPDEQPGPRRPGMCVCVCVCVCMCVCATARVRLCDHVLAWSSRGHTRSRSRSPSLALVRVRLLSLSLSLSHFLHLTLHLSHCQGPASNVADRSFKEHNMASAWNGVSTYTRAGSRIARSLTHAFRHT